MSGIVVGIDASSHSMAALNWAMRAAAARNVPLTVVTVEVVVASGWGGSQVYGADYNLDNQFAFLKRVTKLSEERLGALVQKLGQRSEPVKKEFAPAPQWSQ